MVIGNVFGRWMRLPDRPGTLLIATTAVPALFALLVTPLVVRYQLDRLYGWYFVHQDLPLLALAVLAAGLLIWIAPRGIGQPWLTGWQAGGIAAGAGLAAYAGTWLVMQHYAQSIDEQLADFAAAYLQHGHLGQPIPPTVAPFADAVVSQWATGFIGRGYWVTNYLPGSAAIRAVFGWLGDRWLASPAMLVVGLLSIWDAARHLWPERREAAVVALVLAASSAQVLAGGMSPNAMGTHFAVNALWLACFVRDTRRSHAAAMVLSLLAIGLHQIHFHVMFALGFVVWLFLIRRWRLGLGYVLVLALGLAWWKYGYGMMLDAVFGPATGAMPFKGSALALPGAWLGRLKSFQPHCGWLRFFVWNNVLTLPLSLAGAWWWRRKDGSPGIAVALAIGCAIGLVITVYQGFGFGNRYMHPVLPCFALLAAHGWVSWNERRERRFTAPVLWASAAAGWLFTVPAAAVLSYQLQWPYNAAHRAAESAPADVVVVIPDREYLSDIVRPNDAASRPLLMDMAALDEPRLRWLCGHRRVMLLDHRQADRLGVPDLPIGSPDAFDARRALMERLGCAVPVPVDAELAGGSPGHIFSMR